MYGHETRIRLVKKRIREIERKKRKNRIICLMVVGFCMTFVGIIVFCKRKGEKEKRERGS